MPRRLITLLAGLSMATLSMATLSMATAGCGRTAPPPAAGPPPGTPTTAQGIDEATAAAAFATLTDLDAAWHARDCAAVVAVTTWVEKTLGGRACAATRNGRPAPARTPYSEPVFFLPEEGAWFAALAMKPKPGYFVFVQVNDTWRLGFGPVPAIGDLPGTTAGEPDPAATAADKPASPATAADKPASPATAGGEPDPVTARRARLVPQRHLTFLTDPAGLSGVRFPDADPVRRLRDELAARPARARPDRLSVDVELLDTPRVIGAGGPMLVFHTLRLTFQQRGAAHPLYGKADLRAFTGKNTLDRVTGIEIVSLVSELTPDNKVRTVGLRRDLADVRP
ncbi:hypothetical protein ACIBEJ_16010 [Nonomuraea sp. NPDC050790]|uniref:hypothetical protein n=1 Tax=Nonomuraea sp. NPDC050790 TaxID=3364371 RepID=UPI0037A3EDA5